MSRKTDIENALLALDGGAFQKLAESYVYRKLSLTSLTAIGSSKGNNKVAKGIPDAHSFSDRGLYLIGFTTNRSASFTKLCEDVDDCLRIEGDANHPLDNVCTIVCCHNCWRLEPWQEQEILKKAPGRVLLLGPSTMVEDLCYEYADLASDHLGISIGNGSLMTVCSFIDTEESREYTTPLTTPFKGRHEELSELLTLVDDHRSVLVTGAAGLGKTRLAIEAVKRYASEKHYESYVIDSHSRTDIASDINLFLRGSRAIVLVDDVDQLVDLHPLMRMVLSNTALKLVVTVRDYAASNVKKIMDGYAECVEFAIPPLSDQEIESILRDDYGIANPVYIDQINRIARGNLRLAIMASVQAVKNGYPAIRSAYDILDMFFRSLSSCLTEEEMRILEECSLHGTSDLVTGNLAYDRLVAFGMTHRQIQAEAKRLSDMSILDMLENDWGEHAVRFEQQNLKDYCVYKALVVDRIIGIEEYIRVSITSRPDELCAALNVLLGSFADADTTDMVKKAALKYWQSLPQGDVAARAATMEVLHNLLAPYDLEFAKRAVTNMSFGTIAVGKEYQEASIGPASLPMGIACGTKGGPRWAVGMELVISIIERGGDSLGSYKVAFERLLAPSVASQADGYRDERALLERLIQLVATDMNCNAITALVRLCELYLRLNHESYMQGDGPRSIRVMRWMLPRSEELGELRSLALKGLVLVVRVAGRRSEAIDVLCNCFFSRQREDALVRSDLLSLAQCLKEVPTLLEGEDRLLFELQKSCSQLCLDYQALFVSSPSAMFVAARHLYGSGPRERRPGSAQVLEEMDEVSLDALLAYCCTERAQSQLRDDELDCVVDRVMLYEAEHFVAEHVLGEFEKLCARDATRSLSPHTLVTVINACGYSAVRKVALRHGGSVLLSRVDELVPDADVNEHSVSEILACQLESSSPLCVDSVLRIDDVSEGFAHQYWTTVLSRRDDSFKKRFLSLVSHHESSPILFKRMVGVDTAPLRALYLAYADDPYFDSSDSILAYLYGHDPSIVDELVGLSLEMSARHDSSVAQRLGYLSGLADESFKELARAVDLLADCDSPWLILQLLSIHNAHLIHGFSISVFVKQYMISRWDSFERIGALSIVIGELTAAERFDICSNVFAIISDEQLLRYLPVYPMSFSGFGDEGFVPQYVEEIGMLAKLSDGLPNLPEYVAHRVKIAEMIDVLERDMGIERWNGFHERY